MALDVTNSFPRSAPAIRGGKIARMPRVRDDDAGGFDGITMPRRVKWALGGVLVAMLLRHLLAPTAPK